MYLWSFYRCSFVTLSSVYPYLDRRAYHPSRTCSCIPTDDYTCREHILDTENIEYSSYLPSPPYTYKKHVEWTFIGMNLSLLIKQFIPAFVRFATVSSIAVTTIGAYGCNKILYRDIYIAICLNNYYFQVIQGIFYSRIWHKIPCHPFSHLHSKGLAHVPCMHPGNVWHSLHISPVHPKRHLYHFN